MNLHERYQTFCRFCHAVFEEDTAGEAIAKVVEHENEKHKGVSEDGVFNTNRSATSI